MTERRKTRGRNLHSRTRARHLHMMLDEPEVINLLGALTWGSLDRAGYAEEHGADGAC
jgi:hypothetical protein